MHPNDLWQSYCDMIEKMIHPKSTHLQLVWFSVAWLKSHYLNFQPNEQQEILFDEIFNVNFNEYPIESQELTAFEDIHRLIGVFKKSDKSSLLRLVKGICFERVYPTLMRDCPNCSQWGLKPMTDGKGNLGYFCDICMQDFGEQLRLSDGEFARPLTLIEFDDFALTPLLLPNPLKKRKS